MAAEIQVNFVVFEKIQISFEPNTENAWKFEKKISKTTEIY